MNHLPQNLKILRKAVIFVCCFFSIAIQYTVAEEAKQPEATTPVPRLVSYSWQSLGGWYRKHAEDIDVAEKGEAKMLFIGDSITSAWEREGVKYWNQHFSPMGAVDMGIGGDMTQNVLWRLDHGSVMNLNPERVVCLIGINNFGFTNEDPDDVSQGIVAVVEKLRTSFPQAKILLFAVFPKSEFPDHPSRALVKETNEKIQWMGTLPNVTFMDIGDQLLEPSGVISKEIMADFLHLTEKGYEIWTEAILQWIESTS